MSRMMENRKRPGSASVSPSGNVMRTPCESSFKRSCSNGSSSSHVMYSPNPPPSMTSSFSSPSSAENNNRPSSTSAVIKVDSTEIAAGSPNLRGGRASEERAGSVTSMASGHGCATSCTPPVGGSNSNSNINNSDNNSTVSSFYCSDMMRTMNEFRDANILCDVTICVGGKTFTAHRTVLAAASPYFKALFSSKLNGMSAGGIASESECKPVILTDIDAECMNNLLKYIYTGEIELSQENIKDVISASNYLLITTLKERCTAYLQKILTPKNCLGIETTASNYDCELLRNTATSFIRDNFITVSSTEEFLTMDAERLRSLVESDATRVDREEQIYEAIMKWLEHDQDARRPHFKDLITNVRFPLISPYYLMDHVESNDIVRATPECIALLLEAKNYHMLPDRRGQLKSSRTIPRHSMGIVNGIIAVGGIQGPCSSVVASTSCYLLCRNQWFVLSKMQTPRCRHGLAVTGEFVYAAGGQYREGAAQSSLANVERYDPKTNTWSAVSQMLTRRSLLNLAALEGFLYAVGGCDENNMRLSSVERYNPATDSWTFIPNMSTSRSSPSVATEKYIYVIGGVSYVGMSLNCAERYDPRTNTWSRIASMNCCRASACCALVNGKIYVIGGWNGKTHLNSGECYDPKTDKWSFISPALSARWDAGVAVDSEKLYLVGGCDRNAVCTLETECYNTENDSWCTVASLPVATHGLKCCTIQLPSKFV